MAAFEVNLVFFSTYSGTEPLQASDKSFSVDWLAFLLPKQ